MKSTLLIKAISVVSILAPASTIAGDHSGSDAIKTALSNATLSGEVYGGYTNSSNDFPLSSTENKQSEFDFDSLRLGLQAEVKQDVTFGFELEWLLDESDNAFGSSNRDDNDLIVNDLYLERAFGNTTVTLGRYKQLAERGNYIEMRDRVFTGGDSFLGADRRVDGLGVRSHNASGLHLSANVYKGGVDRDDNNGTDDTRNFGYSGSIGWIGGSDDLQFGATFALYQEDGDELSSGAFNSSADAMGYSLEAIIGAGPIVAGLSWADNETENDSSSGDSKLETSHIGAWGAWNIANAARSYNEFGVLQGPSVNPGDWGYELALKYGMGDDESKFNGSTTGEEETDFWGIAFNVYCGSYTKWYAEYASEEDESDFGATSGQTTRELDVFRLGGRLAF